MRFRWNTVLGCLLLACCLAISAQAQDTGSYLEPIGVDQPDMHRIGRHPKVREVLLTGLDDEALARVLVLPSFEPEYVLSIERQGEQNYLLYNRAQQSTGNTLEEIPSKPLLAETKRVAVSKPLATALETLWSTAILQARYPVPTMNIRGDGTTFYFVTFLTGIGWLAGQTWSPSAGTPMASLVSIVADLQKLVASPTNRALEEKLIRDVGRLNQELEGR